MHFDGNSITGLNTSCSKHFVLAMTSQRQKRQMSWDWVTQSRKTHLHFHSLLLPVVKHLTLLHFMDDSLQTIIFLFYLFHQSQTSVAASIRQYPPTKNHAKLIQMFKINFITSQEQQRSHRGVEVTITDFETKSVEFATFCTAGIRQ